MRRGRSRGRFSRGGTRKVNVPNLSGLSRSQAKTLLESLGLTWSESSSTVQNINLDNAIESQGVASGSTLKIGDSVSFSYYLYVAPPPAPPSGPPAGPPPSANCVDDDATQCIGTDLYQNRYDTTYQTYCSPRLIQSNSPQCGGGAPQPPPEGPPPCPPCEIDDYSYCSGTTLYTTTYSPSGCRTCSPVVSETNSFACGGSGGGYTPPPSDPPAAPPSGPPAAPPEAPPEFPPIFDPPWDYGGGKSVSVSTLVRTPSGLVRAENLNVGDVLISADLEGFPYNPGEGVTEEALAWTSENPNINFVNTTIVNIIKRIGNKAVVINGDIFSQYHWILVKRNNVIKFVLSEDIVENSDYIFDPDTNTWEIVDVFEIIEVDHETISIDCEPYDMFFTEKMLTHDSFAI